MAGRLTTRRPGPAPRPRISVIVCAHNEEALLPGCLHSLLAQLRRPDEVLVINNASTDATGAIAAAVPGVRLVDEPRKGKAAVFRLYARNFLSEILHHRPRDAAHQDVREV